MENNIKLKQQQEDYAKKNCILNTVAGSHAIGTNIPSSDWDERGIFATSKEELIFNVNYFEQVEFAKDDIVLFELKKYLTLLHEQNPNFIEMLWTEPSDILHKTEAGDILLQNREKFLTKNVFNTYVSYATSQLKRIYGHSKWIDNPMPEKPPEQKDFMSVLYENQIDRKFNKVPLNGFYALALGDNNFALFDMERTPNFKACNWIDNKGGISPLLLNKKDEFLKFKLNADLLVKYRHEDYKKAHTKWSEYWTWKANRNEVRSGLEMKFGYDTKHAMHIIRLLESGEEILRTGEVKVRRENAEFLLDIRFGKYSYEDFLKLVEDRKKKAEEAYLTCKLPEKVSKEYTQKIMVDMYESHWGQQLAKDMNNKKKFRP